jgi:hypothetical protein
VSSSSGDEKGDSKAEEAAQHHSDDDDPAPMAPPTSLPEQELGIVGPGLLPFLVTIRHHRSFQYRLHRSTMTRTMFSVNIDRSPALALHRQVATDTPVELQGVAGASTQTGISGDGVRCRR